MRILQKLRSRRGESLAETLCAVLVAGLAVSLLAGMVGASSRIASRANEVADSLYAAVSAAEKQDDADTNTKDGKVTVTVGGEDKEISVIFYGDKDEVQSYTKTNTTGTGGGGG